MCLSIPPDRDEASALDDVKASVYYETLEDLVLRSLAEVALQFEALPER